MPEQWVPINFDSVGLVLSIRDCMPRVDMSYRIPTDFRGSLPIRNSSSYDNFSQQANLTQFPYSHSSIAVAPMVDSEELRAKVAERDERITELEAEIAEQGRIIAERGQVIASNKLRFDALNPKMSL
jgi:hypothetical protein